MGDRRNFLAFGGMIGVCYPTVHNPHSATTPAPNKATKRELGRRQKFEERYLIVCVYLKGRNSSVNNYPDGQSWGNFGKKQTAKASEK